MSIIPASSQPVGGGFEYSYNQNPSVFEGALTGLASVMTGMAGKKQQSRKELMSLLPVFAQMNQLERTPQGGTPDVTAGGMGLNITPPSPSYSKMINEAKYKDRMARRGAGIGPVDETLLPIYLAQLKEDEQLQKFAGMMGKEAPSSTMSYQDMRKKFMEAMKPAKSKKPPQVPQGVWDDATEEQKQIITEKLGR